MTGTWPTKDPGKTTNLAESHPELGKNLQPRLRQALNSLLGKDYR